jgi:hypothetical protein
MEFTFDLSQTPVIERRHRYCNDHLSMSSLYHTVPVLESSLTDSLILGSSSKLTLFLFNISSACSEKQFFPINLTSIDFRYIIDKLHV